MRHTHTRPVILMFAAALAVAGFTGCGGNGDDTDETPTAGVSSNTPVPFPTIEGNVLTSTAKGYAVTFPEGWRPRPNFFTTGGSSTDAFFTGEEINGAQPNISVTCSAPPQPLETVLEQTLRNLLALRQVEPTPVEVQVSGQPGWSLRYEILREGTSSLDQEDVYFVDERCTWKLSLVVPGGTFSRFEPEFRAFIEAFELIPVTTT